jgi:SNF2 family DNA or RNA helicase
VNIPAPKGLSYLPFQLDGIRRAASLKNVLIADDMGLGKTVMATGTVNADPAARKILVVCPNSLKANWAKEFRKWDVKGLSVEILKAGKSVQFPNSDVVVVNYDLLRKFRRELRRPWDVLIVDECHYLKNGKSGRTKEVFGGRVAGEKVSPIPAHRRIFLSGSPIVNRPKELWPLVRALDPKGLGANWRTYAYRYCAGFETRFGFDWSGASHTEELQEKLRSRFMIRRLKRDVLTELPAKRRQVISLEMSAADRKIVEKEKQSYAQYERALADREPMDSPAFAEMSRARKETALAKVPYVLEYLVDLLENCSKIVIMAVHHDAIDAIKLGLAEYGVVGIDGRTSEADRAAAVESFQTDPKVRVFVGSIRASGTGLTLTASSTVVFAELDWVPGNITQAEDRCHRIGATAPVNIYHLVLEGSLDERMAEMIIEKQRVIDSALDEESFF